MIKKSFYSKYKMTSTENFSDNKYIVPKAPKPKINIVPRIISHINLIEVDDDSESSQPERSSNSSLKHEKMKDEGYISDDRYEDSFDEEFGDGCETNPDSGNSDLAKK